MNLRMLNARGLALCLGLSGVLALTTGCAGDDAAPEDGNRAEVAHGAAGVDIAVPDADAAKAEAEEQINDENFDQELDRLEKEIEQAESDGG